MARSAKRKRGRYTPSIDRQVAVRLEGVTNEMALEALEAQLAAEGGPIAELADFARAESMREFDFAAKVTRAREAGHQWAELGALFDVSGPTLRQRYRRTLLSLDRHVSRC